jgi:hypothetical protein
MCRQVGDASAQVLTWVDFAGHEQPTAASGRPWAQPRIARDGRRAITSLRSAAEDLWLVDLERGTVEPPHRRQAARRFRCG